MFTEGVDFTTLSHGFPVFSSPPPLLAFFLFPPLFACFSLLPTSIYTGIIRRHFAFSSLFLGLAVATPVIFLKIIIVFTNPFSPLGCLPEFLFLPPTLLLSPNSLFLFSPLLPFSRQRSLVVK